MTNATIVAEDVFSENEYSIASTQLSNGYVVSTVRLSPFTRTMDSFLSILPLEDRADLNTPGEYETMVFKCDENCEVDDWEEQDFARYSSAEAAKKGHKEMVEKWLTS